MAEAGQLNLLQEGMTALCGKNTTEWRGEGECYHVMRYANGDAIKITIPWNERYNPDFMEFWLMKASIYAYASIIKALEIPPNQLPNPTADKYWAYSLTLADKVPYLIF